ncbi:MAG: glycerophosphodiester phosphodiesterase, partial [Proteobacteria bacterium]|nr:glycerophosphodiester phosphodiesterase [Pseudomonadota bacterium]
MNDRNCYISKIASHRAGALLWGELTPQGFKNTLKLPVEQVELDIHATKDRKLVVMHDYDIGRVTDTEGEINKMTWAQLS